MAVQNREKNMISSNSQIKKFNQQSGPLSQKRKPESLSPILSPSPTHPNLRRPRSINVKRAKVAIQFDTEDTVPIYRYFTNPDGSTCFLNVALHLLLTALDYHAEEQDNSPKSQLMNELMRLQCLGARKIDPMQTKTMLEKLCDMMGSPRDAYITGQQSVDDVFNLIMYAEQWCPGIEFIF